MTDPQHTEPGIYSRPQICGWCRREVWSSAGWSVHAYGLCIDPAKAALREQESETLIRRAGT